MHQEKEQHDGGNAKPKERQLEEILQDPSANWADIRKAMKARGQSACTNAALMRAIAAGQMSTPDIRPRRDVSPSTSTRPVKPSASPNVNDINAAATVKSTEEQIKSSESGDDSFDEYFVPTYQEPLADDALDSGKSTRKSRRMPRMGSMLITQSVNIMDFGVDNFAELEDEVESVASAESNYTCDSKGFLSWKHSDDEASVQSNLSGLCDSDGFLTWELTASARAKKALVAAKLAEMKGSLTSESTNLSKHCDSDGFLSWEMSASIRAAKSLDEKVARALSILDEDIEDFNGRKSWHIEDCKGSSDEDCNKRDPEPSKKKFSFLTSKRSSLENQNGPFWSNLTHLQPPSASREHTVAAKNEAVELDNIKEALLKRCSVQAPNKQPQDDNSKPTLLKRTHQFHSAQSAHRSSDLGNSTSCTDTREAIWINQTDGGVDIEKECRKLYLLDSEDREEKMSGRVTKYTGVPRYWDEKL
ncbi:hypothetical protein ACHAWO_004778 [Cyclotella atomus]|uniref:Uncharacterized protein n=1 Tax=Cyclotella atomus TaxID=382360 RepID=A0ABD3NR12_9STRA